MATRCGAVVFRRSRSGIAPLAQWYSHEVRVAGKGAAEPRASGASAPSFANWCEGERGMLGKNVCYWGSEAHENMQRYSLS